MKFSLKNDSFDEEPYVAQLHGFAGNLAPPLRQIKLAHILAGDTCSPIGLSDLEAYLSFIEHTLENLQFTVWYQSYRERFYALPQEQQALSPGLGPESEFAFSQPGEARTQLRHQASLALVRDMTQDLCAPVSPISPTPMSPMAGAPLSPTSTLSPTTAHPLLGADGEHRPSVSASLATGIAAPSRSPQAQPFRDECARIVATFFRPGASKELSLSADVRDTVVRNLTWNTHPDVFLPAYEEAYHALETISMPRFLLYSSAVTNRPKQLFWYLFGLTDLLLGLAIFLALELSLPVPPQGNRAWRLFAVPLATLGPMKMYTAWRGFCLAIHGRGHVQLRPWELQEADTETGAYWSKVVNDGREPREVDLEAARNASPTSDGERKVEADNASATTDGESYDGSDAAAYALAARLAAARKARMLAELQHAPFADDDSVDGDHEGDGTSVRRPNRLRPASAASSAPTTAGAQSVTPKSSRAPLRVDTSAPAPVQVPGVPVVAPGTEKETREARRSSRNGYRRPAVFGPEKVVMEPRIKKIHKQINLEIHLVGLVAAIIFTALFLAVPGRM